MRYLAIDHGQRRIGLAICDPAETICSPVTVIDVRQDPLVAIVDLIDSQAVEAIVVGLPLNMDGTEGAAARAARDFAGQLQRLTSLPIHFQDERLSSFAADEKLAAAELSRKDKKKRRDAVAAAHILETFLESRK